MDEQKRVLPAYVAFKTFLNYIEGIRGTMPHQLDRSTMGSLSGSSQSQLSASLEYLKLTKHDKSPTPLLEKFLAADSTGRPSVIREIINSAYGELFKNGITLEKATPRQLEEFFRQSGATGNTVNQCLSFLINLAKFGSISLSPYLSKRGKGIRNGRMRSARAVTAPQSDQSAPVNSLPSSVNDKKETTLRCLVDILSKDMPDNVRDATWTLIQYLKDMHKTEDIFEN